MKNIFILIALASILSAQPRYDLLLQGGYVIDAKNNISAARGVAIRDGKIAAVTDHLEPTQAFKVVIVRGPYVTPGLVTTMCMSTPAPASLVLMPETTACIQMVLRFAPA